MWLQYVADVGSAAEQVAAASTNTSLRRMSRRAIAVLGNENNEGVGVFPEETGRSPESAGSEGGNNEETGDKVGSVAAALSSLGNSIAVGIICLGYPVAILPYYRAESTTEWVILAKHPIPAIDIDR